MITDRPLRVPRAAVLRRAWLGVAGAAVAVIGSLWFLRAAAPAPAPPAAAPAAAATAPLPHRVAAPQPVPRPRSSVAAIVPAVRAAAALPRPEPATGAEICGYGPVQLADDDPYPLQRIPPGLRQATLEAAEGRLLADADPHVRAAGLLIGVRSRPQASRAHIDGLARLAGASQDPLVYALALQACQGVSHPGPCQLLSHAQAAQLDPDNALAWLALAGEAAARGDADAEHEAMRRAALAREMSAPLDRLPALVAQALAPPQSPTGRPEATGAPSGGRSEATWGPANPALQLTLALAAAIGLHDAWRLLPAGAGQARTYCMNDAAESDGERAAVCRPLAQLLLAHGPTLADLGTGLALGRRWGLASAALAAPQQEHDALLESAIAAPDPTELGCAAQAAQTAWAERIAQVGERRAMRDELRRQGRSLQEWSERHRRTIALASAAAEAAAEPEAAPIR